MLLLVMTHGIRPGAKDGAEENRAHSYNEANTRTVLRTGAVHALHTSNVDSLDDLLLGLLCNLIGANRQSPVGPDEMAGVAIGISLEIILMLGFGLPEVACGNDFRNDLARPQA